MVLDPPQIRQLLLRRLQRLRVGARHAVGDGEGDLSPRLKAVRHGLHRPQVQVPVGGPGPDELDQRDDAGADPILVLHRSEDHPHRRGATDQQLNQEGVDRLLLLLVQEQVQDLVQASGGVLELLRQQDEQLLLLLLLDGRNHLVEEGLQLGLHQFPFQSVRGLLYPHLCRG